jgi:hypothetical protein
MRLVGDKEGDIREDELVEVVGQHDEQTRRVIVM